MELYRIEKKYLNRFQFDVSKLLFIIETSDKPAIDIIERVLQLKLELINEKTFLTWCSGCVHVIFHKERVFSHNGEFVKFGTEKHFFYDINQPFFPILHISVLRHLNLQDKTIDNSKDYRRGHIHRHQYVLDSSIWNYYYSYEQAFEKPITESNLALVRVLNEIYNNYTENLYGISAAIEYADFQRQLVECSRLAKVTGGHSDAVSPFLFHSETAMKSKIDTLINRSSFLRKVKWRFLLVDDHAASGMSNIGGFIIGKADIIKYVLKKSMYVNDDEVQVLSFNPSAKQPEIAEESRNITIHCVTSIEDAKIALNSGWRYDLILLDYKLMKGKKVDEKVEEVEKDDNCIQEYGYHLLEQIKSDYDFHSKENKRNELLNNKKTLPGPNGVYYFMFISAYSTAVQERMRMEGFRTKTDYWFLDRGACPLNTPYLFLYSLKRMIDNRFEMLTNHSAQLYKDLALQDYGSVNFDSNHTLISFLSVLFEKDERNRCVLGFNAFLNLRRMYDSVKNDYYIGEDNCKSSPLIKSLFPDIPCYSNSFWEHLQNLVYLTAFGTIRQWPEMWEDYMFIKTKLEKAEDEIWKVLSEDEKKNNAKPSFLIRNYILNLKGMMS